MKYFVKALEPLQPEIMGPLNANPGLMKSIGITGCLNARLEVGGGCSTRTIQCAT